MKSLVTIVVLFFCVSGHASTLVKFDGLYNQSKQQVGISGDPAQYIWSEALHGGTIVTQDDLVMKLSYRGWSCEQLRSDADIGKKMLSGLAHLLNYIDGNVICYRSLFTE